MKSSRPKCMKCKTLLTNPDSKKEKTCRECAEGTSHKKLKESKLIEMRESIIEKVADIHLDEIRFSKDNPRFFAKPTSQSEKEQIETYMDDEDARTLKKQILTDGQQYDEPVVRQLGSSYIVEEGNRRTAARKSILDDVRNGKLVGATEKKVSKMRCKILRKGVSKAEVRKYLASEHLSGKKEWPSASKGHTIYQMIKEDGEDFKSVSDILGTGKTNVKNLYYAYKLTAKFCKRYGSQYHHTFSYFEEYCKKPLLQKQAEIDPDFEEFAISLVHQRKMLNHKHFRLFAQFYDPNEDPDLCKLALDELKKPKKTILDAYDVFVNYSSKGTIDLIEKATKLIDDITIVAMKKTKFQDEIPKAGKKLMKSIQNMLDTHKHLTSSGASAI